IDQIVVVSTSGIATPSLDVQLMNRLPFRADVQRLPIFGLGCAGGTIGLARAAALAKADPAAIVLLLVVELCGLTFRAGDHSKSNIVATALFGDGAAAALISTKAATTRAPGLSAWGEHTWPDTLDLMGWHLEDDGFGVIFSRDIPAMVRQRYRAATDEFLIRVGIEHSDLAGYIFHPGGTKVIGALEAAMDLPTGAMSDARKILRQYGNMSAATVLFVLQRTLAACQPGQYLMSSLGPGFTAGFLLIDMPEP
ncbi:MAG: type III polyketide synthase, partial [Alphaproteobacteria bacterium]